jgi:hypothetical protein
MGRERREDEILRKRGRRSQKRLDLALSKQFNPRFLEDADSRISVVRTIRKNVQRMMQDAGGHESYQKEILCKRAVFIATLLESLEVRALEGEALDWGSYVQACNGLCGLLGKLGLSRAVKKAGGLQEYIKQRNGD